MTRGDWLRHFGGTSTFTFRQEALPKVGKQLYVGAESHLRRLVPLLIIN